MFRNIRREWKILLVCVKILPPTKHKTAMPSIPQARRLCNRYMAFENQWKSNMNGEESVKAWMDGIKPEHVIRAKQVDTLIKELIPEIQCTSPHILNVMAGLKYRIG